MAWFGRKTQAETKTLGHLHVVVGLGNPGARYDGTRHNVGFDVADALAETSGSPWKKDARKRLLHAHTDGLDLIKPITFMNLSGQAVQAFLGWKKLPSRVCLIVADDIALPLGKLRLRPSGSAGGHNGLRSIIQQLGGEDFPRLKLGVGGATPETRHYPEQPLADFVLKKWAPIEISAWKDMIQRATECVRHIQRFGLEPAMNQFN
ncbi:MAG: aminoacyl-tRNA hydrolase [Verrucomicrobiales bacterium]